MGWDQGWVMALIWLAIPKSFLFFGEIFLLLVYHISTNFTDVSLQPSCAYSWLKPHPLSNNNHGSWPMAAPTEQEISFTARNGGPTRPEDHFLRPFMQRRREMANRMLTRGYLQLSPEAAMLLGPRVETHPPPPVPPFLELKSKSQGPCWNWHHKLKVVWCRLCVYCV